MLTYVELEDLKKKSLPEWAGSQDVGAHTGGLIQT
jgi:hypothetical protein